ncbi:helix-turn-helix domain-containing protein [Bailinhaonella thermotolerans]|nr:helix-turn-helix transcriptional regulator [Bailinhaonella thermotolerans]
MGQRPRDLDPYRSLRHYLGARLRHRRTAAGLSLSELAGRVYLSQSTLRMVELGERPLDGEAAARLDAELDTGEEFSSLLPWTGREPGEPGDGALTTDLLTLAWMVGRLGVMIDRRTLLQLATTVSASATIDVPDLGERLQRALTRPRGLSDETLTLIEDRTAGWHLIEAMLPAPVLMRGLTAHLREVTALLETCPRSPVRARLARAAGETAVLAAWASWDAGHAGQAARYFRAARTVSEETEDTLVGVCAAAYRSYMQTGPDAPVHARALLSEAREAVDGRRHPLVDAWLLAREAEEAAALGDPAATGLIRRAEAAYHTGEPQARPWVRFLNDARLRSMQLRVYALAGDETRALPLVDELAACAKACEPPRRAAVFYSEAALATARVGDHAQAVHYAERAADLAARAISRFAASHLADVENALARSSLAGARAARQRVAEARRAVDASPR